MNIHEVIQRPLVTEKSNIGREEQNIVTLAVNPRANKYDIRIVRRQPDGSEREYRFNYNSYVKGRAPGTNIVLQNGDTIIVQE